MPSVTFVDPSGTRTTLEGEQGMSVMEVAVRNGVNGIIAECGGAAACATCHVYVAPEWLEKTGAAKGDEKEMLGFVIDPAPESRLSCQIRLVPELDGLVVRVPTSQY